MRHPIAAAVITIVLAACDSEPRPAAVPMHDHTPHHGGVVTMIGMLHLEAAVGADGRVRVYVTDRWRQPMPLDGFAGSVTLQLPDGPKTLPFVAGPDALEAEAPPLRQDVVAAVKLRRGDEPIEAYFSLPVGGGSGAAGVPVDACVAPSGDVSGRTQPRCVLSFAKMIAVLAGTPDGSRMLVAVVDNGISAWQLPAGTLRLGFAAPPAVPMPVPEAPHPEAPNAVVVRPDGREVAVALENRLVVYDTDTGQVLRSFVGPGGIVRAVAWAPDGTRLLVTTFYNTAAILLDAGDGRELRRFAIERDAAAIAFAADGRSVAVGSEIGVVTVFDAADGHVARRFDRGTRTVRALAFAGPLLIAAGEDGTLRACDPIGGNERLLRRFDVRILAMRLSPDGARAAVAVGNRLAVVELDDGETIMLDGHDKPVIALAWPGTTIASGDAGGRVALWDAPAVGARSAAYGLKGILSAFRRRG